MLKLRRLLMLIAVASLAAGPVMACCLTGHAEPAASQSSAEAQPCHDVDSSSSRADTNRSHQSPSPMDCPGCLDCDSAIMQTQASDASAVLTASTTEIPYAVLRAQFPGYAHQPVIFKTGPPGDPPNLHHSPITLKQRLLI